MGFLSYLIAPLNNSSDILIHESIILLEFGKKISCSSIKLTNKSFEYCCNDSSLSCRPISFAFRNESLNDGYIIRSISVVYRPKERRMCSKNCVPIVGLTYENTGIGKCSSVASLYRRLAYTK